MSWSDLVPTDVLNAVRTKTKEYRLNTTGFVKTKTRVKDASGGYTYTDGASTNFNMGIAAGIKGQQQLEQRLADRIGNKPYFVILAPLEVDIQLEHIIQETPTGRMFRVLAIENKGITLELLQRVIVIEVFENVDD